MFRSDPEPGWLDGLMSILQQTSHAHDSARGPAQRRQFDDVIRTVCEPSTQRHHGCFLRDSFTQPCRDDQRSPALLDDIGCHLEHPSGPGGDSLIPVFSRRGLGERSIIDHDDVIFLETHRPLEVGVCRKCRPPTHVMRPCGIRSKIITVAEDPLSVLCEPAHDRPQDGAFSRTNRSDDLRRAAVVEAPEPLFNNGRPRQRTQRWGENRRLHPSYTPQISPTGTGSRNSRYRRGKSRSPRRSSPRRSTWTSDPCPRSRFRDPGAPAASPRSSAAPS